MANMERVSFNERVKAAFSVLRGRQPTVRHDITIGEEKVMPIMFPDWRTETPSWNLIDYENYVAEGFAGNSLIYSAIMYRARSMSQVPLRAYTGTIDAPEALPLTTPLGKLTARPNFHQSFPELAMQSEIYKNISGNCYFLFDRPKGGGLPINILCLRPDRIRIVPTKDKKRLIGYLYSPEGTPWTEGIGIVPQDLMHVKDPNPGDPLEGMGYGLSPLAPLAKSADVDNDITDFLKRFFERGVMVPGILSSTEYELDDPTVARVRERWKEIYGGYEKWAEEIGVMDKNMTYQRIGLDFQEMGFDSIDMRNEGKILGPLGVPPSLIASRLGMTASTENNRTLDRRMFWEDTMIPELDMFEREWQYYLQGERGEWVAYDTTNVVALQQDTPALIEAAQKLWQMGMPLDQAINEVGLRMEPTPGGDIGWITQGLMPSGFITQAPMIPAADNAPLQLEAPSPDAEDEDERQDDSKKGFGLAAPAAGHSRLTNLDLTQETKLALATKVDLIAWEWTPEFTRIAIEQFEIDFRELSAALTAARTKSIQEKATVNWQWLLREWTAIFAVANERWREAFLPAIEGLIVDQGQSLNVAFGAQFNIRNLFAEDWFTDYTGEFSEGIIDTTRTDMNEMLQQGMSEGWSIPTMQKHLAQMFGTWQGKVDPASATWDWLNQRIPSDRTEMIARTETIRASARGSQGLYGAWGLERKEWLVTEDDRLCVVKDTVIAVRNGGKLIQEVQVGDEVLTRSGWNRVTATMFREYEGRLIELSQREYSVIVTPGHRVWDAEFDKWRKAEDFGWGDSVLLYDGSKAVLGIAYSHKAQLGITNTVYNLTIADAHEFYANGILVHNCDWCRPLDGTIIAINDNYFGKGSVYSVPSSATGNPVSMNLSYEDVQGPPLHVNCRCALMPVLPDEGIETEAESQQVFMPATTLPDAMRMAQSAGINVATTPQDMARLMADAYEKRWGWDATHTREAFVANQLEVLKETPEAFQLRIINAATEQVSAGRAEPFPLIMHMERQGFNDRWVTAQAESDYIKYIYHPKDVENPTEPLGPGLSDVSIAYENQMGGTYVHEWGHRYAKDVDPGVERRANGEIDDRYEWIKQNVSRYAVVNPQELAAEAYTMRQHPDFETLSTDVQTFVRDLVGF